MEQKGRISVLLIFLNCEKIAKFLIFSGRFEHNYHKIEFKKCQSLESEKNW